MTTVMKQPNAELQYTMVRGTTPKLIIMLQSQGVGMRFDAAIFTAYAGNRLAFREGMRIVDVDDGRVELQLTAAQTRMLTPSKPGQPAKNTFEIEWRDGQQEHVFLTGTIMATGGLNSDIITGDGTGQLPDDEGAS